MPISNDEMIKMRSRIYRGYRAPVVVSEFLEDEEIQSVTRDGSSNIQQIVHRVTFPDGRIATRTTDYSLDGSGNIQSSTITYNYT